VPEEPLQAVVAALLAAHADVRAVDQNGATALHYAAIVACTGAVSQLLRGGADVAAATRGSGLTALHVAAQVEGGAETTQVQLSGETLRIVDSQFRVGHGGDSERSLNDGQIPIPDVIRVALGTGYHRVEGSRRASRNGPVSDLPPETLTSRFATFPSLYLRAVLCVKMSPEGQVEALQACLSGPSLAA
jgi:hypothetical protein